MDMYADCVYGKEMLDREIAEGVFVQDEQKCYYLYERPLASTDRHCSVSIDYLHQGSAEGSRKEQDMWILDIEWNDFRTYKPIRSFLICLSCEGRIACMIFEAEDGIQHRVWIVDDDLG